MDPLEVRNDCFPSYSRGRRNKRRDFSEPGRAQAVRRTKRSRRRDTESLDRHALKHAKKIRLMKAEVEAEASLHGSPKESEETLLAGIAESLLAADSKLDERLERILSKLPTPTRNLNLEPNHCHHCNCHLPPLVDAELNNSCANAIRSLATECAKTEEELQLQLESLRAQLEAKERFRGKNLIPTVLHRLREYMEMTRKLHKRLLEAEKETRQTEDQLGFVANAAAAAAAGAEHQNAGLIPLPQDARAVGSGAGAAAVAVVETPLIPNANPMAAVPMAVPVSGNDNNSFHKHDLVEAIADAAKKVMDGLQSLVNSSDEKIRSAFDFEKTFNREILPSTFAYALPVKTILDKFPRVLCEADTAWKQTRREESSASQARDGGKRCEETLMDSFRHVDDAVVPSKLGVPSGSESMDHLDTLKAAASNFFNLIRTQFVGLPCLIQRVGLSGNDGKDLEQEDVRYWADGRIPFMMDSDFTEKQRRKIWKAMDVYQKHTKVRFVPRIDDEDDYLFFRMGKQGELCSSFIGCVGGKQDVVLNKRCLRHGSILHELNHVLGFEHEHSRCDRDNYITINWDLIKEGCEANFAKHSREEPLEYDYFSIMHYPADAFSKYGNQPTIVPKSSQVDLSQLGQRWNLSRMDVEKINAIYGHPEVKQGKKEDQGGQEEVQPMEA